jgi:hypothetical protein
MAKVTIETAELMLSKVVAVSGNQEAAKEFGKFALLNEV